MWAYPACGVHELKASRCSALPWLPFIHAGVLSFGVGLFGAFLFFEVDGIVRPPAPVVRLKRSSPVNFFVFSPVVSPARNSGVPSVEFLRFDVALCSRIPSLHVRRCVVEFVDPCSKLDGFEFDLILSENTVSVCIVGVLCRHPCSMRFCIVKSSSETFLCVAFAATACALVPYRSALVERSAMFAINLCCWSKIDMFRCSVRLTKSFQCFSV